MYTAKIEIADYTAALEKEDTSEIEAMLKKAQDYNKALSEGDEESVASYDELLAVTDAIGYLEIPKINVYMPIYHGIDTEVLERGIGHMPDTSLPVGGISTHCVLSGHTGLPAAKILTDLDQMKEGDLFYIHVLNETLAYKVDQIKVVLPEETDDIRIVPGKDYVTLLTCTPYGVNSHRLLVRGERTEYVPEEMPLSAEGSGVTEKAKLPVRTILMMAGGGAAGVVLVMTLLILFVPFGRKKKKV